MIDFTVGMKRGDIERLRTPSATSTQVNAGSPAMSPQTAMGLPAARAPSIALLRSRRNAGWSGWYRYSTSSFSLSAAKVYWIRSLVPMLRKLEFPAR